jgi:threonine/homoserine/homoserine lactone efflux protein
MKVGTVASFVAIDLMLVFTPGADWAYVIATGLREASVLPAVAGLVAGYGGLTLLVVAGLAVLIAATPAALTGLTLVGAAYLFWLGASILSSSGAGKLDAAAPARSARRIVVRGAATSGLNPKGLLLYVALLPQFVSAGAGWPIAVQTGVLGALHMADCAAGYLAVGAFARTVLATRPRVAAAVSRAAGLAMITLGGLLLLERLLR